MPTDLEMRFLSNLLDEMGTLELRRLLMHVAEREFEVVGEEALKITEGRRPTGPRLQPHDIAEAGAADADNLESDLESYTLSDDQEGDDSDYDSIPNSAVLISPRHDTRLVQVPSTSSSLPIDSTDKLRQLLDGLRTKSQRESLTRIAGIIDNFNWKTGKESDFIKNYTGTGREYATASWPPIVRTHGDRLRKYSKEFAKMYPYRKSVGRSGIKKTSSKVSEGDLDMDKWKQWKDRVKEELHQ